MAQPTKQAFLYVFNRETGEPIWPIEERPVPKGDVPGEWYSPTQPFPTKPPAYERQGVSIDDLIDFTPELRAEAMKLVSRYKIGPMFTPPVVSKREGPLATLTLRAAGGGTNWPGGSYDPETHIALHLVAEQVAQRARARAAARSRRRTIWRIMQGNALTGAQASRRLRCATAAPGRRRRPAPRASRQAADRAGSAAGEAAIRPHQRDRSRNGRHRLAGRRTARRPTTSAITRR